MPAAGIGRLLSDLVQAAERGGTMLILSKVLLVLEQWSGVSPIPDGTTLIETLAAQLEEPFEVTAWSLISQLESAFPERQIKLQAASLRGLSVTDLVNYIARLHPE
jgi:hypothetical protein